MLQVKKDSAQLPVAMLSAEDIYKQAAEEILKIVVWSIILIKPSNQTLPYVYLVDAFNIHLVFISRVRSF